MKAAVLEQLNEPLAIREIVFSHNGHEGTPSNTETPELSEPLCPVVPFVRERLAHGQVLVRVLVAGICGAQLQEIRGDKGDPAHLPHLLGHEGCGIVEQIGPGVKHVKEGDKVVLHWRKSVGADVPSAQYKALGTSASTTIKSGPLTCFSEYTIVSENRVTSVPQDFPDDLACLLGCSLSTALGVIENEARVKMGESVMIVGCGGVGLALILAARLAHAYPIIAVDKSIDKLDMVRDLGADYFADDLDDPDIQSVDVVIDTTGNPSAIDVAADYLAPSGRMILVGQPSPLSVLKFSQGPLLFSGTGKTIKATQGGCFSPSTDIPRYINLWRSGALDGWENLITHRVSLDDINKGLDLVREGKAGRVLVDMVEKNVTDWRGPFGPMEMPWNLSGGLSGGNEVADVIQSQPLTHSPL